MRAADKKIKRIFKELRVPVSYEERVDDMLTSLREDAAKEEGPLKEKEFLPKKRGKYVFRAAACLLCICVMFSVAALHSKAGFWENFRRTLMDFFGFATGQEAEENGVESRPLHVEGKKDLFVELQEAVMGAHSMYLLVKVTAPTDIVFAENIGFDYFGFCEGENYDVNRLLSGSRDCRLLEVGAEKPNEALYVASINFDQELSEGTYVTCFLQNLAADPYGDEPELLVEGIWSMSFPYELTDVDSVTIEGGPEAVFPYIDDTAVVERVELTPTGMVVVLDVSSIDYELMNVSDTTVAIKLLYVDGSKKTIVSHTPGESFIQGGSISYESEGDMVKQQQNLEFSEVLDIGEVMGVYIEELYMPVK